MPRPLILVAAPLLLLVFAVAGIFALSQGGNEPERAVAVPINRAPLIRVSAPQLVHQGYETTLSGALSDPDGDTIDALIDFGDGEQRPVTADDDGAFRLTHSYRASGDYTVRVIVTDARGKVAVRETATTVAPRATLFIQGIESESRCPGGDGFLSRAPAWVARGAASGDLDAAGFAVKTQQFAYFSYSGRFCPDGRTPDYADSDTCDGIAGRDGAAAELKRQVEKLAPSRVTILGHSMGGLTAAYLVASEPEWARQHIASVVTFDSPLEGVPNVNLGILGLAGDVTGGCGRNSDSVEDMDEDSGVVKKAAGAANIVPFYTIDAVQRDGLLGLREAVPGSRTHLPSETFSRQVEAQHTEVWTSPGDDSEARAKLAIVACALARMPGASCNAIAK